MHNKRFMDNTFFWFMGLMGKRLPIYLLAILVSTVGLAGSKVAKAFLVQEIIDAAQSRQTEGLVLSVVACFILFVLCLVLWRCGIIRYNIEAKTGVARVEKQVFTKALRLPMEYYETHHSGDFMSKLIFDTERAGDIYGSRLRRLIDACLSAVIFLLPMLYFCWQLTLCLLAVSVMAMLVNVRFAAPLKRAGSELSGKNGKMTEKLTNILAGVELTKLFPAGKTILRDYEDANVQYTFIQEKTNRMHASLEGLNTLFDLTGALAFLGFGVWFIVMGIVDLGELTAIYTLYGSFRFVFLEIAKYYPQMMNCIANAQKLQEFLSLPEEQEHVQYNCHKDTEQNQGMPYGICDMAQEEQVCEDTALETVNLTFSYDHETTVLKNFSMKVRRGECVAITGASGCGKSTLAKLLLGFYKPQSGDILIHGKKYDMQDLAQVRRQISYVPQEPYLYEVSIAQNIAFGKGIGNPEDISMDEIIAAAKAANAHDFIMRLPKGYDTIVGERGNKLSGGEKQRIAIARAVFKNAPVFLLDEATSALDNESERLVNEALDRISKERTTIMIAHRSSTIAAADRVIAL